MAKEKKNIYTGTGHRKTSVARVSLTSGTGKMTVNVIQNTILKRIFIIRE